MIAAVSRQIWSLKFGDIVLNRRFRFYLIPVLTLEHHIDLLAAHIPFFLLNIFFFSLSQCHDDCMCTRTCPASGKVDMAGGEDESMYQHFFDAQPVSL